MAAACQHRRTVEPPQHSQKAACTGSVKVVLKVWRRLRAPSATVKKASVPAHQSRNTATFLELGWPLRAELSPLCQALKPPELQLTPQEDSFLPSQLSSPSPFRLMLL